MLGLTLNISTELICGFYTLHISLVPLYRIGRVLNQVSKQKRIKPLIELISELSSRGSRTLICTSQMWNIFYSIG